MLTLALVFTCLPFQQVAEASAVATESSDATVTEEKQTSNADAKANATENGKTGENLNTEDSKEKSSTQTELTKAKAAEKNSDKEKAEESGDASIDTVFIGDSYAAGYNGESKTWEPDKAWPVYAAQKLNTEEYLCKAKGGVGFARTVNGVNFLSLLTDAAKEITDKEAVKLLVICGGYNDYGYDYDTLKEKAKTTIAYAQTEFPNAKIIVGMVAGSSDAKVESRLMEVTQKAYADAASETGASYLTNGEYILQNGENVLNTVDGFHPNQKGQEAIADYVYAVVNAYTIDRDKLLVQYHSNQEESDTVVEEKITTTDETKKVASKDIFKLDFGNATFLGWSKLKNAKVGEYFSYMQIRAEWMSKNYPIVNLYAIWAATSRPNYTGLVTVDDQQLYCVKGVFVPTYSGIIFDQDSLCMYCIKNGYVDTSFTNLGYCKDNGLWYYFEKGKENLNYTSLYHYNGGWYYVQNGLVNKNYTGLVQYNGGWYYVKNGTVDFSYTGLYKYNNVWYYLQKGQINWNYSNLVQHNGGWYYVHNGKIDWSYSTLARVNNSGRWYYVEKGVINWSYTGLASNESGWFYVKKGVVDFSYNGLCLYKGGWYYLQNGKINWNYSNLVLYNGSWYYVHNGKIDWSYSTLARVNNSGRWYYVEKGVINWSYTGLASNESGWYYVNNGVVDFSFNGLYLYRGSWYYLQNGRINWNYSNLVQYNGSWYYVHNGKIDWNYTTLSQVNGSGAWYYVRNGVIDWSYSGNYTYQGRSYQVKNGIVTGYAGTAYPYAVFIGDSYGAGYSSDLTYLDTANAWPALTAQLLNCKKYVVKANQGSGFVNNPNGIDFKKLLTDAYGSVKEKNDVDLLVICGGYNDSYYSYNTVKEKTKETIAYAKSCFPNAKIVLGMVGARAADSEREMALLNTTQKAYEQAAEESGIYYISGGAYLLLNADQTFSSDSYHPNSNGQKVLANYISSAARACYLDSNNVQINYYANNNTGSSYSTQIQKNDQGYTLSTTDVFLQDFGNATFLGWSKLRDSVKGEYASGASVTASWAKENYPQTNLYAVWLPSVSQSYSGLIKKTNGMFYYQNGKLASYFTGLVSDSGREYYVQKGIVYYDYNGLAKVGSSWCYIANGALDINYSGLVSYNSGWYYVQNGYINWDYSNLVQYNGSWYYVRNGKIDWSYSTLAQVNGSGKWYYVHNGKVDKSYNGYYSFKGRNYYVRNGVVA